MLRASSCSSPDIRACRDRHAAAGGQFAVSAVVDGPAHTVYVANGPEDTVSVINAATCNAIITRGCAGPAALIRFHGVPQGLALDSHTGTLYADLLVPPSDRSAAGARATRELAVISTKACDASASYGCGTAVTVPLGAGIRGVIAVDQTTGTVYAAEGSKLAVIDGRACAAGDVSGCSSAIALVQVYGYITGIDAADAGMVYVASPGTGTVTAIRTRACNALTTAGCASPALIRAGAGASAAAAGPSQTLYVTDAATNTASMVDLAGCGGAVGGSCPTHPSEFPVGADPGPMGLDPATHALYVGNLGSRTVSIISTAACDAITRRGCPTRSPADTPPVSHTPYTCDPDIAAYESGQSAAQFAGVSARAVAGTVGGENWSVWARKDVFDPNGIEQGGLVLGGRWYALCSAPLVAGADANIELIDTPGHGTVYGYIQYPRHVTVILTGPGLLPRPVSVPLRGTTFFIDVLPRSACAYHTLTLRAQLPGWGDTTTVTLGACEPRRLVDITASLGAWGPGYGLGAR
jgi:DNA-binding beta-propeller fold protein YncE